jgi:hypothetical protein
MLPERKSIWRRFVYSTGCAVLSFMNIWKLRERTQGLANAFSSLYSIGIYLLKVDPLEMLTSAFLKGRTM